MSTKVKQQQVVNLQCKFDGPVSAIWFSDHWGLTPLIKINKIVNNPVPTLFLLTVLEMWCVFLGGGGGWEWVQSSPGAEGVCSKVEEVICG